MDIKIEDIVEQHENNDNNNSNYNNKEKNEPKTIIYELVIDQKMKCTIVS